MWRLIGHILVDAGMIWIGDPCYILHTEPPPSLGKNWDEFCDLLPDGHLADVVGWNSWDDDGLGAVVSSGYGDGEYPVYVRYNREGRVTEVKVVFDEC